MTLRRFEKDGEDCELNLRVLQGTQHYHLDGEVPSWMTPVALAKYLERAALHLRDGHIEAEWIPE